MPNYKLDLSVQISNDLSDIIDYMHDNGAYRATITTLLNRIYETISRLTTTPLIGVSLQTKVHEHTAYRFVIVDTYIIFYKLDKNTLYVDRILSEKQDYLKILGF